jgi:glycosyltransferase involved in cell wall biosynthesis
MNKLAIIIPAYKETFLKETLESLASQTDKDFSVYIGDDCSPNDLEAIVQPFCSRLNIRYVRFENNMGAKALVTQWERCVRLMDQEDWIWVFADDDVAQQTCVEEFRNALRATNAEFDIYSFNTTIIDQHGVAISTPPDVPVSESEAEYAYNLLLSKRANCMSDHIFSATAYRQYGGFVHTDYAQAADWLNSILFAKRKGIRHILNAVVFWRYSGTNISSQAYKAKSQTIKGYLQFTQWILEHFEYLKHNPTTITYNQLVDATRWNLQFILTTHYRGVNLRDFPSMFLFIKSRFHTSLWTTLRILISVNTPGQKAGNFMRRFTNALKVRVLG